MYFQIPCLAPAFQSQLENMFLFQLLNTLHRKILGDRRVFRKVIEELNLLATEGITIKTSDGFIRIYFALGVDLGLQFRFE